MKYRPPTNGVGRVHFLPSYGFDLFFKVIYVKLFELFCVLISKRFYKSKYVYYKKASYHGDFTTLHSKVYVHVYKKLTFGFEYLNTFRAVCLEQ